MVTSTSWLDDQGMLHGPGVPVLSLDSTSGQARLATMRTGISVQLGPRQFMIRPESKGEGHYWYALKRCQGKLHKIYLGLQSAITMERLREIAQELETRCGSVAQAPSFDIETALSTVAQAKAQLQ